MQKRIGLFALFIACIGLGGEGYAAQHRVTFSGQSISAATVAELHPGEELYVDVTGGKSVLVDLSKGEIDYDRIIIKDGAHETTLGDHIDAILAANPQLAIVSGGSFTIRGLTMSMPRMSPDKPKGGGGKGDLCCFCVCDSQTGACSCICQPCINA